MQEVLSWISACLLSPVGVKVPSSDPEKLRQAVERAMRSLPERPPISLLTRKSPEASWLFLVRNEFMNGKKLDNAKAIERLESENQSSRLSEL